MSHINLQPGEELIARPIEGGVDKRAASFPGLRGNSIGTLLNLNTKLSRKYGERDGEACG